MAQTIQQQRAKYALDEVNKLSKLWVTEPDKQKKFQSEFTSYACGLPAMIHMNGLGQAMAFCKTKGKDRASYEKLYQIVSVWLCKEQQPYNGYADVLAGITEKDRQHYQLAQAETLALMSWVKKFAKAFLADEG